MAYHPVNLFNKIASLLTIFLVLSITGCGGSGGGGGGGDTGPTSQSISGGAIKGPLTGAIVTVFAFDGANPGFKGAIIDTGTTDNSAAITGLALPLPLNPPYIMEFTSDVNTIDLTTGAFPVITTMRTVITQAMLDGGGKIYATPLTTMAVDIAVSNAVDTNGTAGIQADEFETALAIAASQVVSTLGFGLDGSVDIFDTPPLVDDTTVTIEEQANVAAYRAAMEAVTAIAYQIDQETAGGDTDSVLAELAADLADDGDINGSAGAEINANTLQVLQQDPAGLEIPTTGVTPTGLTVSDIQTILINETATTGTSTNTDELNTATGSITTTLEPAQTNTDFDADGVLNADDAFPNDATADTDTDGDGAPDIAYTDAGRLTEDTTRSDADDDNDGWLDTEDDFPTDATRFLDPALDRDSDTVVNGSDNCPLTSNLDQADLNTNGLGDVCDDDADGDGVSNDGTDNCPVNTNPSQTDTDTDGEGDACDTDIDGDTVLNDADAFPLDSTEQVDTDGDGVGDVIDTDDDNDGVADVSDTGVAPAGAPSVGVACSLLSDCDGDGYLDNVDQDPVDPTVTVNFAPVALDGDVTTNEDTASPVAVIGALATDSNGDALTITSVSTPSNGGAVINGNNIDYTPDADYFGSDLFTYTVSDGSKTDTGTIAVTVTAINDAPVVDVVGPFSVSEIAGNGTVVGTVTASDIDGAIAGYSITGGNIGAAFAIDAAGQITVNDAAAIDFETSTSFTLTVTATDGTATSAGQNVTININDANDTAPVVGVAGPFSVNEDAVNATNVGTPVPVTDVDTVGVVTGFSITGGNTGSAFAIDAAGQITVNDTTAIDFETATSFVLTVVATDGVNVSSGQTVTVNINDVNDEAPAVTAGQSFPVAEDAVNTAVVGTVAASDVDTAGSITGFNITGGNTGTAFAIDASGQITVNDTAAIDYESATSFTLTVTATDGVNTSAAENVTINVSDANDTAPVVTPGQSFNVISTAVNTTVVGNVAATDVDTVGSITGFTITAGGGGELGIDSNGQITVVSPLTTAIGGSYVLTVTATDGTNISVGETVTVNVVSNTPPVIGQTGPLTVIMDEDGSPTGFVAPTITATDAENDSLSWSTPGAGNGTATVSGSGVGSTPTITYSPNGDYNGSDSFVVNVFDGTSTVGITVNVTINPQNDAPVAVDDDSGTTLEDTLVTTINVLTNDTDVDVDGLSVSAADLSSANGGVVANNGNGTFDYTPAGDFNGIDTFTYTVTDGFDSSVGTVTIDVIAVNDAPVAVADSASTNVNVAVTTGNVLTNDTDAESDVLSVVAGNPTALNGAVVNNGDGTFDYTPATDFIGTDSFDYTVTDGALTDTGTVTVTVSPPGLPIAITTLMDATNGGVAGIEMGGPIEFAYWIDNFNSATGVFAFDEREYSYSSGLFETIVSNDELLLNGTSWVAEDNIVGADDGSNGLDIIIRDQTNAPLASYKLTAQYKDIAGDTIISHLEDAEWQAAMVDTAAVFASGAKLITEYRFEALTDSYRIWLDDWCINDGTSRYTVLGGSCNGINVDTTASGYAEALGDVIAASTWVDPDNGFTPPGSLYVANNDANNTDLLVQFVAGGVANYYVFDNNAATSAEIVTAAGVGTWVQNTDSGVDMIQYQIPAPFVAQFPDVLDEGLNFFVTVQAGFVRQGSKDAIGDVFTDANVFNGAALTEILANFDAVKALGYNFRDLVGSVSYEITNTNIGSIWCLSGLTFTGATTYDLNNSIGNCSASSFTGLAYSLDPVTGVMTTDYGTVYKKVVGYDPQYDAFKVCSNRTNGLFNCTEADDQFTGGDGVTPWFSYEVVSSQFDARRIDYALNNKGTCDAGFTFFGAGPYSYTQYLQSVVDCGAQPITANDIVGNTFEFISASNEDVTFNSNGSGVFTDDGGITTEDFTWSLDGTGYLTITNGLTFTDVWVSYGTDWQTGGALIKAYSEGDNQFAGDRVLDGVIDGEMYTEVVVPDGYVAKTCNYESGWDDTADGGFGAPINPNSFAEFEATLWDCAKSASMLPFTATDIAGNTFSEFGDLSTFDALTGGQLGTEANPGTGVFDDTLGNADSVIEFIWWVEQATCIGCIHSYVVLYSDGTISSFLNSVGLQFRETNAITAVDISAGIDIFPGPGDIYTFKAYSEQSNYGDMVRDNGSDGEIWTPVRTLQ